MSLPERQQEVLDQIEQSLHQSDPGLRSMFAGFAKLASPAATPAAGASTGRRAMMIEPDPATSCRVAIPSMTATGMVVSP